MRQTDTVNLGVVVAIDGPAGAGKSTIAKALADDLGIEQARVNLKAKTNERLGWEGREEGIAAHAVALVYVS